MRLRFLLALSCIFLGAAAARAQVPVTTAPQSSVVEYVYSPAERVAVREGTDRRWENVSASDRDKDDDGVVETAMVLRQAGSNAAAVNGLDRVVFVGPSGPAQPKILTFTPDVPKRSAVGTINQINIVPVNGVETLLVRVNTSVNGPGTYVDLGPVSTWPGGTIQLKKVVSASGPVVKQGERAVIIAERAALNAQPEFPIARPVVFVREL